MLWLIHHEVLFHIVMDEEYDDMAMGSDDESVDVEEGSGDDSDSDSDGEDSSWE